MTEETRLAYSANHVYREGYEQGKADTIDELKSKADCGRCYECAMADANLDCMLGLKEQNNG